jgi:hypothetical protein
MAQTSLPTTSQWATFLAQPGNQGGMCMQNEDWSTTQANHLECCRVLCWKTQRHVDLAVKDLKDLQKRLLATKKR